MKPKTQRNKRIVRMVDVEGRNFKWIGEKLGISLQMARKIYHREKELQRQAQIKAQEAQV